MKLTIKPEQVRYTFCFALIMLSFFSSMIIITDPVENIAPIVYLAACLYFLILGYEYFYKQGHYVTFYIFFLYPFCGGIYPCGLPNIKPWISKNIAKRVTLSPNVQ